MKSFWKDNNYLKISLYAIFVAVITILFYRFSSNSDNIAPSIMAFLRSVTQILMPILYGLLIAYLLNPIMIFFEKYYIKWLKPKTDKQKKSIRTLSIISVYVAIIGLLIIMVRYLVPQIGENIRQIIDVAPTYIDKVENSLASLETTINDSAMITSLLFSNKF